jgi:hypothetical protein
MKKNMILACLMMSFRDVLHSNVQHARCSIYHYPKHHFLALITALRLLPRPPNLGIEGELPRDPRR